MNPIGMKKTMTDPPDVFFAIFDLPGVELVLVYQLRLTKAGDTD
jgi:hypothetical protein